MNLEEQRVLLTGAGGGIGRGLALELSMRGARLALVGRRREPLEATRQALGGPLADEILVCPVDLTDPAQRTELVTRLAHAWGGVDLLINLAGALDFSAAAEQDPAAIERILATNVAAPLQLTRALLPGMLERGHGRVVNVGSMFGSIGFPGFAAYAASKFALRGYSQALRRELAGSGVGVTYVAPRGVDTALNPPAVQRMARDGLMRLDEPAAVARGILRAIERGQAEAYPGLPEGLFARLNALFPCLLDLGLRRQTPRVLAYAREPSRDAGAGVAATPDRA